MTRTTTVSGIRPDKAVGDKCSDFNQITLLDHCLGRSPDVLTERYDYLLRSS